MELAYVITMEAPRSGNGQRPARIKTNGITERIRQANHTRNSERKELGATRKLQDACCRSAGEAEGVRRRNRRSVKRMVARGADLLRSVRARKHHTICGNVMADMESILAGGQQNACIV
jgi:hypothetical protein